jgi:subtilisin family serine protease
MLIAALLFATSSTLCHATPVQVTDGIADRTLDRCGEAETENLLWHLDRADNIGGALNGTTSRTATGKGAVVYVCDTGVMAAHDELARDGGSAVIGGINMDKSVCPGGGNDATSPCWTADGNLLLFSHGTSVAVIVAGKSSGIAPDAKIVAVKVIGDEKVWIKAMHAILQHAYAPDTPPFRTAIINISGGVALQPAPAFEALMRTMISGADADGNPDPNGKRFLFCVAAGNAAPLNKGLPAQCAPDYSVILSPGYLGDSIDGLITVGGLDQTNGLWWGSCFSSAVDVLAPAADMFVASISGKDRYRYLPAELSSGTSYATPYVSGLAARLLEKDPSLTPAQLEQQLKDSRSIARGLPVPVDAPAPPSRRRALR